MLPGQDGAAAEIIFCLSVNLVHIPHPTFVSEKMTVMFRSTVPSTSGRCLAPQAGVADGGFVHRTGSAMLIREDFLHPGLLKGPNLQLTRNYNKSRD